MKCVTFELEVLIMGKTYFFDNNKPLNYNNNNNNNDNNSDNENNNKNKQAMIQI